MTAKLGRPESAGTLRAVRLWEQGENPYRAALRAGIPPSSMYRALARRRKEAERLERNAKRREAYAATVESEALGEKS